MDIFNLAVNTIFGATAGYVTNNFAIKMLFRKYGPFGGVILKTKNEFIKNTSNLVEREIINHHTLENELKSEEVQEVFYKIVNEIFSEGLPEKLEGKDLKDIPAFKESLINFIDSIIEKNNDLANVEKRYNLFENIFNEKQLHNSLSNLYEKIITNLSKEDNDFFENLLTALYNEISQIKIKNLIHPDLLEKLYFNIEKEFNNFNIYLENNLNDEVDDFLIKAYDNINIENIVKESLNNLDDENIKVIFNDKLYESLIDIVLENLIIVLNSEEGKHLFGDMMQTLFLSLKESDIKFNDIIKKVDEEKSKEFIDKEFNYFLDLLKNLLDENKEEIEELLEESLEDVLKEGSGFKNSLHKLIYSFIGEEGIAKYEPVEKIKEFIDKKLDGTEDFIDIEEIMEEYGPGEFLLYLQEKDILSVDKVIKLLEKHNKEIKDYFKKYILKHLSEKKIVNFVQEEIVNLLLVELKEPLISLVKKNYIFADKFSNDINILFKNNFEKIKNDELKEFISPEIFDKYLDKIENYLLDKLSLHKEKIIQFIIDEINKGITKKDFELDLFGGNSQINIEENEIFNDFIENTENISLDNLTSILENNEEFSKKINNLIISLVEDNLGKMLEGKIEEAVSGSLNKLNDKDIQQVVEDFVGRELKPITLFGGGLGAIGGALLYLMENMSLIDPSLYSGPFLSILIYGFIGYLTNVIALWMIFHPYNEKKLFSFSLPLTPGVVSQNKNRFAKSMGKFVDNELLNASSVSNLFGERKTEIVNKLQENITENSYQKVDNMLKNNSSEISHKLEKNIFNSIKNNEEKIAHFITDKILNLKISTISNIVESLDIDISDSILKSNLSKDLSGKIKNNIDTEQKLNYFLDENKEQLLKNKINQLSKTLFDYLLENTDLHTINSLLDNIDKKFSHLKLNQIVSKSNREILKEKLNKKIAKNDFLVSVAEYVDKNIFNKLEDEQKFGELLSEDIISYFKNNENLNEFYINKILGYLNGNKEAINAKLLEMIYKKLGKENNSFLGKLMFNLSGVDELTESVVDHLLDNKLPVFLRNKSDELDKIVIGILKDLANKKNVESGFRYEKNNLTTLIQNTNKNKFYQQFFKFNNYYIEKISEKEITYFKNKINISTQDSLDNIFTKKLNNFTNYLIKTITENRKELEAISSELTFNILKKKSDDIKLEEIFKGIENEDLTNSLYYITKSFSTVENLNRIFYDLIFEIKDEKLIKIINKKHMRTSIEKIIKENEQELKDDLEKIIPYYLENLINLTDFKTLDYFSEIFLETGINSLQHNFIDLVNAFKIKNITEKEVNQMSPEEIEDLFFSFAGRYINRLKIYGWSGGSFGILSEILLKYIIT